MIIVIEVSDLIKKYKNFLLDGIGFIGGKGADLAEGNKGPRNCNGPWYF